MPCNDGSSLTIIKDARVARAKGPEDFNRSASAKETRKNNFAAADVARTLVSAAPRLILTFWGILVRGSTRVSTRQAGVPAPRRLRSKCEVILPCALRNFSILACQLLRSVRDCPVAT